MKYRMNHRVRYSEIDSSYYVKMDQIVNYFQDCSTFQSEDIKHGYEYLQKKKRAWLLLGWQIIIERFPVFGEELSIGTWAYDWKKIYGYRNFDITDADGQTIAYANSIWVYTDTETLSPAQPDQEELDAYGKEPRFCMDYAPRKIRRPSDLTALAPFTVLKSHIDTNEHVNNTKYISFALEYLPDDFCIYQLRTEYKKAARKGDILYPYVSHTADTFTVLLCDKNAKPYVTIEFKKQQE